MDRSKNIETSSQFIHHRPGDDYFHQKSKHSRNKTPTFNKHKSWFTKSNPHSPSTHDPNTSDTSYGYIKSLPTSSTNHGWIHHPQYGMILFTYNQAVETARYHKQIVRKYSGYLSESESYNENYNENHLDLPGKSTQSYRKYSGYNSGYRSRSPSPSPIPMNNNNSNSTNDSHLSDINRLYVYQPVKFELVDDQQIHSPICNLSENEMIVEKEYDVISKDLNWRNNNIIHNYKKHNNNKNNKNGKSNKYKKHKNRRVFNDGDDTDNDTESEIANKSQRMSRKSRYSQQKQKQKQKLGPRPTKPVPLPPPKRNKKRHSKKHLSLQPSISLLSNDESIGTSQRIAMNVKPLNSIQSNDIDCNLYCFSPRGKHYTPMQFNYMKKERPLKEKNVLYEIDLQPSSKIINDITHENKEYKENISTQQKRKIFPRLRKKSRSDGLHEWANNSNKTSFCPSMNSYYVKDACLLHWEGKDINEIKQHGVKKCMTKKLLSECNDKIGENVFFSMTNDMDGIVDELEEKINRLFNNNGGTIYIGIKSKKDKRNKNILSVAKTHTKSSSFTFTKGNILNKSKSNKSVIDTDTAQSPIATVRNHIVVGIKVNSKMRYKLSNVIVEDILKGFVPQVSHLLENFDLQFIPVISQDGKILKRIFVIKISVVAPILGVNGEKIQFRTKDGYAHVVDF